MSSIARITDAAPTRRNNELFGYLLLALVSGSVVATLLITDTTPVDVLAWAVRSLLGA